MDDKLYLLYLDGDRMGDAVFLQNLARVLAGKRGQAPPCLIVHGSGEVAERALEGQGYFPERRQGVIDVGSPEEAALVDRSVRQFNKKLVSILTDEVVSAVGVQGVNRNVLRLNAEGDVVIGALDWIEELVAQGVVPVLSALAYDPEGRIREVPAATAAVRVVQRLSRETAVVVFTKNSRPGLEGSEGIRASIAPDEVIGEEHVPEPEAIREVAAAGVPVLLTDVMGLGQEGHPQGTWVKR